MAAEARVGPADTVERFGGAMERFGGAGMALLPWTKHMLVVLWEQLRLLVQVIIYTFMSVFQMFRFEVHVRITDDPSVTPDPSDPFLFTSLFSEDAATDHTGALLSSLRGEDAEGGVYLGHKLPSSWAVGDWNIFVSSSEARCSDEERSGTSCWSSEEEHGLEFDCDESKALWESLSRSNDPYNPFCFSACISTRSKALWETLERVPNASSEMRRDAKDGKASWESAPSHVCGEGHQSEDVCASSEQKSQSKASWETESRSSDSCSPEVQSHDESEESWETKAPEEAPPAGRSWESRAPPAGRSWESRAPPAGRFWESRAPPAGRFWESRAPPAGRFWESRAPPAGRFWESSSSECSDAEDSEAMQRKTLVCRSDSDSSWSSENSENGSETSEQREENDRLWDLFNKDPFNPFNPVSCSATNGSQEEEHDAEEELWSGLSKEQDPYHPLNFTVLKRNHQGEQMRHEGPEEEEEQRRTEGAGSDTIRRRRGTKPELTQRSTHKHTHPQVFFRPWTRASSSASEGRAEASSASEGRVRTKRVRFSDEVQVHIMRSWLFARQASRRGQWEESARDRERFKRRILETEKILELCLSPEHRERARTRLWTSG
ncbi:uncharacterized protein [Eucyclogobius newberryi]|uniref:uncharacterized protein n=1 Tax=Eucyclogobius newberryi TaxID=166745 RepID=UPI003B5B2980